MMAFRKNLGKLVYIFLGSFALLLSGTSLCGQSNKKLPPSQRKISIHSENNQIVDATTTPPTQYLNGDVKLFHAGTFMYCDTAILRGNFLRMRHNVVMLQSDSIRIFGDSLRYNGDSLIAHLYGNIILENGPTKKLYTTYIKYDVANKIAYYTRNAKLVDGKSTLLSRRGKYDLNAKTAYFYEDVQGQGENFYVVSDSLAYNTDGQKVIFLAPTILTQDTSKIYCESGYYLTGEKRGEFIKNAQYVSGSTKALGDTLTYDGKKDVFGMRSKSKRSEYYTATDTALAYVIAVDRKAEEYMLDGDAYYKSPENQVNGKVVKYNKKTEAFKTIGRALISDPPYLIEADSLDYAKVDKKGEGHGKVIWRDTSAKTVINSDHLFIDQSISKMIAFNNKGGRPSFDADIEGDTFTLKADTLRSFRTIKERIILPKILTDREKRAAEKKKQEDVATTDFPAIDTTSMLSLLDSIPSGELLVDTLNTDTIFTGIIDTIVYIVGDNDVRIYKSDLQAIGDSLVINRRDSILTLFDNPFMWTDSTQLSGDTVDIFLVKGKVNLMKARRNAQVINTEDELFFNQTEGDEMQGYFDEGGKLKNMVFEGNAKIVYYILDDNDGYIGVNTKEANKVNYIFKDKKISDIKCYNQTTSKVLPMESTDHEKLRIQGFLWNKSARPNSKEDL